MNRPFVRIPVVPDDPNTEPEIGDTNLLPDYIKDYELLRIFSQACVERDIKRLQDILKINTIFLGMYCIDFIEIGDAESLSDYDWEEFRKDGINRILIKMRGEFEDNDERAFFVLSALLDTDKLKAIKNKHVNTNVKFSQQIRNGDSVIIFCLKYGNIDLVESFLETMKVLIENFEVDVDKYDENAKTAIDYVAELHEKHQSNREVSENLIELAKMLINKGTYAILGEKTKSFLQEKKIDFTPKLFTMNLRDQLFYWINTNSCEDFSKCTIDEEMANASNGEITLLQSAAKKGNLKIVQHLLAQGADPNGTPAEDKDTPLALSVVNNHKEVFVELLNSSKTKVPNDQFNVIVTHVLVKQGIPGKLDMFKLLLQWERLEADLKHELSGNSPLHFAVVFSNQKTVLSLLKRGASLLVRNNSGKAVLDIVDFDTLKSFFDSCIASKTAKTTISDIFFKVKLNFFGSLVDNNQSDELYIFSQLSRKKHLRDLLKHPLVHTFIGLKWTKTEFYFWVILLIQLLLLFSLTTCFCWPPIEAGFASSVNVLVKFAIFLKLIKQAPFHALLEILLVIVHFSGLFVEQIRAFLPLLISICFLITAGYHPNLSKWSIMIQRVFKTFALSLIFVSVILLSFALGFFVLFSNDGGNKDEFRNISTSLFKSYKMSAGELSLDDLAFDTSGFFGYLFLVIFTLFVPLMIVNFWTAVAVTDVAKIERESEINALDNVALFIKFVDDIYEMFRWQHCKSLLVPDLKGKYREFFGGVSGKNQKWTSEFSFSTFFSRKPYLFLSESDPISFRNCEVVSYMHNRPAEENGAENVVEIGEESFNKMKSYLNQSRHIELK